MAIGSLTDPRTIPGYVRPHRRALARGGVLLFITNILDKAVPWVLMLGVDSLREHRHGDVTRYSLIALVLASTMWVIRSASRVTVFDVGRDVEFDVRSDVLARLHMLGPSFLQKMATGEIMSRATNDVGQVRLLVGFGTLNVINSIFAFAGGIGLMLLLSPHLTLYAILPYPFLLLIAQGFGRVLFVRSQKAQAVLGKLAERAQESLSGLRVVRAYALEGHEQARFDALNAEAVAENMRLVLTRGLMWPLLGLVGALGKLLVAAIGVRMVLRDELTPGALAAFAAYLAQLDWPTLALGYLLGIVQRGRVSFARVREILTSEPEVVQAEGAVPAGREGHLEVRGLRFDRGDRSVLAGVDFQVPAGRSVAIVGTVGSGKSTLAALLPRLLPTPPGTVFLDGVDVTSIDLRDLRHTIGYAQQEPFLFSTTVEKNVAFALDDEDRADAAPLIRHATEEAAIRAELESLPQGFHTVVGERGVQLSGGQKQRVALARALIADPRVLVLDDPMSAVDARTESTILEAISRAAQGRTLVLVTHRIAAARRCDEILVLDDGVVAERGTHDTLVRAGGRYARIAERQELEAELEVL